MIIESALGLPSVHCVCPNRTSTQRLESDWLSRVPVFLFGSYLRNTSQTATSD